MASESPKVALFVSGGIAAYKACEVLRGLQKAGCDVRVCMTQSAAELVGPKTFEALSGHHVTLSIFDDSETPIPHIELSGWADLALVCPATANVIAKMAHGIADDAVSTTLLACACPVIVAPAMNTHMWQNPATQDNVELLEDRGIEIVGPASGRLACGDVGEGKLTDVAEIVSAALFKVRSRGDLGGKKVVVTAGPTHEPIDPVRYLSNASSGKMGFALAEAAAAHGADVTLVAGPVSLADPAGVRVVRVTTAAEMFDATTKAFKDADAAILSAAVSDYRPVTVSDHKLKKATDPMGSIELVENEDILATLSATRGSRKVIGFAAETNDVIENARKKLERKGCDLIVANDVSRADSTFGADTNLVTLVGKNYEEELPLLPKDQVAEEIVSRLVTMLGTDETAVEKPNHDASVVDEIW
jgi:phosphopantothenoylcysteine decarboxylase / phosphopantothenate---cysteine ligase